MYGKYHLYKKQLSYDSGVTWVDASPIVTSASGEPVSIVDTYEECTVRPESNEYLTVVALEDNFSMQVRVQDGNYYEEYGFSGISYSTDSGVTWTTITPDYTIDPACSDREVTITVPHSGDTIWFKGNNQSMHCVIVGNTNFQTCIFSNTHRYNIRGNIMSVLYGDDFRNQTTLPSIYTFDSFLANAYHKGELTTRYGNTKLVSAEDLVLPATTLTEGCYNSLFEDCNLLTTAPELPATILASRCYRTMFSYCTSLTTLPYNMLPATTMAENCYGFMFYDCESLTTAPELPATTLAPYCYDSMFGLCYSLTSAPSLPATTLASYCYNDMFRACSGITSVPSDYLPALTLAEGCYGGMFGGTSISAAPELPATTLVSDCYRVMFMYCNSLNYIKCLATNASGADYTDWWVYGVPKNVGTFVKYPNTTWGSGVSGIPEGWTVVDNT